MASEALTPPAAPKHLPAKIAKKWQDNYTKAFAQAAREFPDDERKQHTAAIKEANKLLSIPAPTTAAEIDALDDWQVIHRGTRTVDEVETRICVTADGQKYSFPVKK